MDKPGVDACWRCGTAVEARERVGRRDACLVCGNELRCCRNCRFYDAASPNQCREPQAERQVEKERGNFCDWFSLGGGRGGGDDEPAAARARLEALFGGKQK